MLSVRREKFIKFAGTSPLDDSVVYAEINVDTSDKLPEIYRISEKILYQGSTAFIIKEGRIAILSGDGHWYINGKMIK